MSARITKLALAASLMVLPLGGCGEGLTTEEATDTCERRRTAEAACMTDAAFSSCVSCHEECGVDCVTLESCPLQFGCPD